MSQTYPPTNRSKKARLVSHLYEYTTNIAESRGYDLNRGLAAGTAVAVLGLTLDKMKESSGIYSTPELDNSEADADAIDKVASSSDNMQREQSYFMNKFMNIMVRNSMPNTPEAKDIRAIMLDPSRAKKPPLSLRVFVSNLKELSGKMGVLFKLQYGMIHVITWKNPAKTLSFLVVYTCVCLWPHLVLSFPLLFVLFGLIIPGYLYRHPMDIPEILPVKKRGQSLLQFFNESNGISLFSEILEENNRQPDESASTFSLDTKFSESTGATSRDVTKADVTTPAAGSPEKPTKKDTRKIVKSQVSLLMNMRNLQNLTGNLLNTMNTCEKLMNELTGFKDERLTTFIFYIAIAFTSAVFFFGRYIPWRFIFIQSGWASLALCHPNSEKYIFGISKNDAEVDPFKQKKGSIFDDFDREDIIVDDQPEVRIVEIFELQTRNVFKQEWEFHAYSKTLFDHKDTVRVSGKLPYGVDHLGKVYPPKEWKFDFGYANNWRIDTNPKEFLSTRQLNQTHLNVLHQDEEGWIYDKLSVDQELTQEFRRRRLYRTCYRYSRPFTEFRLE